MSSCFSSEPNIEVIDETPEGRQFNFLRPEGTITYEINPMYDPMYDIPEIELILTAGRNPVVVNDRNLTLFDLNS